MFCPKCKAEYKEGILKCADCQVALVETLQSPCESKEIEYEEVAATYNPGDIAIIRSILDAAGIAYYFQDENLTYVYPLVQPARLMVGKNQAAEARRLLKDLNLSYKGISAPGGKRKRQ